MPKSKRDRPITLSKTKKQNRHRTDHLVEEIQANLEKYTNIYIFTINNMRNSKLKEVRALWKDSRIFLGKLSIIKRAIGTTPSDEFIPNIHKISQHINGSCGLLFTNREHNEVVNFFENFRNQEYARAGFVADRDILISEGPQAQFSHSIEPYLRKLGLPVVLREGVILLEKDTHLCNVGEVLTPEQARLLELYNYKLAEFFVTLQSWFDGKDLHMLS